VVKEGRRKGMVEKGRDREMRERGRRRKEEWLRKGGIER